MPVQWVCLPEAGDVGAHLPAPPSSAGWLLVCLSGRFAGTQPQPDALFAWQPAGSPALPRLHTAGPARLACMAPDLDLLQRAAAELGLACQPQHTPPMLRADAALMHSLLDYARRATDPAHPAGRLEMDSRAALISMELLRRHLRPPARRRQGAGGLAPWQLARACQALTRDLSGPPSLAELAAGIGLSRFHFLRAFKHCTGLPPHAWLMEQRLLRAKRMLLADASLPIAALARALGYDGPSQFTRLFRRREGMPPSEFRRGLLRG